MFSAMVRLYEATDCQTQSELAEFLGVSQSAVSDAKKRGSIPAEWLLTALHKKKLNPFWVLSGNGPQVLIPASERDFPLWKKRLRDYETHELLGELFRRTLDAMQD